MLAVQLVHLYWKKDSRTPKGAVQRREYLHPYRIPADTDTNGKGDLFFQKCAFYQQEGCKMITPMEFHTKRIEKWYKDQPDFSESKLKAWKRVAEEERQTKGIFTDDCQIQGIDIIRRGDSFEIEFYSLGEEGIYVPPRHGKNNNLKRETAFTLKTNESGVIRYNYRVHHSSARIEGQHYEYFEIYLVNTDKLTPNTFTKANYEKVYEDIVDLF